MFEEILRELRGLENGVEIPITLEIDDQGYLDRDCPSEDCGATFKVLFKDWREIVTDEVVYCPICRHENAASEWNILEQDEYICNTALGYVQKKVGDAFRRDSMRFNSTQSSGSFIQMRMSYKPGLAPIAIPASAAAIMTQVFQCEQCNCRYASIGAAFFCPACGHNSVIETFGNTMVTVENTIEGLAVFRSSIVEAFGTNVAEDTVRQLLENSMVKLISSFQRYAEASFLNLPNSSAFAIRMNLFQSMAESDDLWRKATSTGYSDILSSAEFHELSIYFQRRHLLAHRDGIVDQVYINRTGDCSLKAGQRLRIKGNDVLSLVRLLRKLADGIEKIVDEMNRDSNNG